MKFQRNSYHFSFLIFSGLPPFARISQNTNSGCPNIALWPCRGPINRLWFLIKILLALLCSIIEFLSSDQILLVKLKNVSIQLANLKLHRLQFWPFSNVILYLEQRHIYIIKMWRLWFFLLHPPWSSVQWCILQIFVHYSFSGLQNME